MRGPAWSLVATAVLASMLAPLATAHPESAAPSLRPDVVRAGHEPDVVMPHTQWIGFLEMAPGSNVTGAYYQVCRVGQACFAPPTPSTVLTPYGDGGRIFRFDTATYLANGQPVDYEGGWRIGVTWLLEERLENGTTRLVRFPVGPDVLAPECQGDAALACAEAHYLAFDIPADSRGSPSLPAAVLLLVFALLASAAGRRR